MQKIIEFIAVLALLIPVATNAYADEITVLELFTAQNCGMAPKSDAMLEKLVNDENADTNLIAFSCHTALYNNSNSTIDMLARPFCDKRQSAYEDALNMWVMETPQFIINGKYTLGYTEEKTLLSGLKMAKSIQKISAPSLKLDEKQKHILINMPELENINENMNIWFIGYKNAETAIIRKGPNANKVIPYVNIALTMESLQTDWAGNPINLFASIVEDDNIDGYIVLAQENNTMKIHAAGKIETKAKKLINSDI